MSERLTAAWRLERFARRQVGRAVLACDAIQRRRHHVFEFDADPRCVLRASRASCPRDRMLSDETIVRRGDPIVEIHYWNEHIPEMGPEGPSLKWAVRFSQSIIYSLQRLAHYLDATAGMSDIKAVYAQPAYGFSVGADRYASFFGRFGFDYVLQPRETTAHGAARVAANLYAWTISWSINPASVRGHRPGLSERGSLWMSRAVLMERHGATTETMSMRPPARPGAGAARSCR